MQAEYVHPLLEEVQVTQQVEAPQLLVEVLVILQVETTQLLVEEL